eukprot:Selendium_serpulae@DN6498_c0_g1_i1.p1
MVILRSLENAFRSCNKYHSDEHFEVGIFFPDLDDYKVQKADRDAKKAREKKAHDAAGHGAPGKDGKGKDEKGKDGKGDKLEKLEKAQSLKEVEEDEMTKTFKSYHKCDSKKAIHGAHKLNSSPTLADEKAFAKKSGPTVEFEEFQKFVESTRHSDDEKELARSFAYWDEDKTGKIHQDYFEHVLAAYGDDLSKPEVKWIIEQFAKPEKGYVDYMETIRRLMHAPDLSRSGAPQSKKQQRHSTSRSR